MYVPIEMESCYLRIVPVKPSIWVPLDHLIAFIPAQKHNINIFLIL